MNADNGQCHVEILLSRPRLLIQGEGQEFMISGSIPELLEFIQQMEIAVRGVEPFPEMDAVERAVEEARAARDEGPMDEDGMQARVDREWERDATR